jgi:hypothetical protein
MKFQKKNPHDHPIRKLEKTRSPKIKEMAVYTMYIYTHL